MKRKRSMAKKPVRFLTILLAFIAVFFSIYIFLSTLFNKSFSLPGYFSKALQGKNVWMRHVIDNSSRGPDGVKLADVNGDGQLDVTAGFEQGGVTRVYINPWPADIKSSWPKVTVGRTPNIEDAVFADLDNDGSIDVVSSTQGPNNKMYINWAPSEKAQYLDAESWQSQVIPASNNVTEWMFAMPYQLDGNNGIDIIAGAKNKNAAVGWFESPPNPRDISTWSWHKISSADWVMSIILSDMDGDGDIDVVVSDRTGGSRWLENPGIGIAQKEPWPNHQIIQGDTRFMTLGDVDQDGLIDAVSTVRDPDRLVFSRRLDSSGDHWENHTIPWPISMGEPKGVGVGDIDLDGKNDLAITSVHALGKEGVMWLSYPNSPFDTKWEEHQISGVDGTKYDLVELTDLDHDGDLDLMSTEEVNNLGVIWYENPNSTLVGSPSTSPMPSGSPATTPSSINQPVFRTFFPNF